MFSQLTPSFVLFHNTGVTVVHFYNLCILGLFLQSICYLCLFQNYRISSLFSPSVFCFSVFTIYAVLVCLHYQSAIVCFIPNSTSWSGLFLQTDRFNCFLQSKRFWSSDQKHCSFSVSTITCFSFVFTRSELLLSIFPIIALFICFYSNFRLFFFVILESYFNLFS